MFCNKCGTQNNNGEKYCKKCGFLLDDIQMFSQVNNENINNDYQDPEVNKGLEQIYINQVVNPKVKKWAVLSIVVSAVGIFWYIFMGLNFLLAILIATVGFKFAKKAENDESCKKMVKIGTAMNGILIGYGLGMFLQGI